MPSTLTIGVVAALDEEADALLTGQGTSLASVPIAVREVRLTEARVLVAVSGIGKVNAAVAATMLAAVYGVDIMLVVGTAGRVARAAGSAYWLADAIQHDFGAQRITGFATYSAGSWPIGEADLHPFTAMADPGSALPAVRIVSGDAFVECPDHALRLSGDLGGTLVDMETAAVAQVAAQFGLPWGGVKAVTDDADGASAGSFQENLRRAASEAAAGLERAIQSIAQN
jgi:adenosylhomocysteine nucleosidase